MHSIMKSLFHLSHHRDKLVGGFAAMDARIPEKRAFMNPACNGNEAARDGDEHPLGGEFRSLLFHLLPVEWLSWLNTPCAVRTQTAGL